MRARPSFEIGARYWHKKSTGAGGEPVCGTNSEENGKLNQETCLQCELTAHAGGGTYFITWNVAHIGSGSDNTGQGALDVDKAI